MGGTASTCRRSVCCSSSSATSSSRSSSPHGASSWRAIGSPAAVRPHGTEIPGTPARLRDPALAHVRVVGRDPAGGQVDHRLFDRRRRRGHRRPGEHVHVLECARERTAKLRADPVGAHERRRPAASGWYFDKRPSDRRQLRADLGDELGLDRRAGLRSPGGTRSSRSRARPLRARASRVSRPASRSASVAARQALSTSGSRLSQNHGAIPIRSPFARRLRDHVPEQRAAEEPGVGCVAASSGRARPSTQSRACSRPEARCPR